MRRLRQLVIVFVLLAFFGCEGTNYNSSVPRWRVRIAINTRQGVFVHFQPENTGSYVVVNQNGYFLNGQLVAAASALDMFGYGGVLIYVNPWSMYDAWDLACPYCAEHGKRVPCTVDGGVVTCPECGEEYKVFDGSGMPSKGLSKETLLRLNLTKSGDIIQVNQ